MKIIKYLNLFVCVSLLFVCSCTKQSDFDKAVLYQNDGEYGKAIKSYKLAIKNKENVAVAEKNLGDIYFSQNKYEDAFKYYKKSIEINASVALNRVIQFISYSDSSIRDFTSKILCDIRNDESKRKMFEALSNILKSKEQYKILDVLEFITKLNDIGPIMQDLLAFLDCDDIILKQKALNIIYRDPKTILEKGYVEKIVEFLHQDNEILKASAIECLGNMNGWAARAIPALIDISINEPNFKDQAWQAIDKIGVPPKDQAENVCDFLRDKPTEVKVRFLEKIGNMREGVNFYVPYVIKFLDDGSNEVKQTTRESLSKIGKASPDSVNALMNLLSEKNNEIVSRAVYELGELSGASKDAIEQIKQIENDENRSKELRKLAKEALQKIQK